MKEATKRMIRLYDLFNIDFMGYYFSKKTASYHHLFIGQKDGGPNTIENGVVLNKKTSHPYLHLIESKDYEIFELITKEMAEQKLKGELDMENLIRINDLLNYFEREYSSARSSRGYPLIKESYTRRLLKKWIFNRKK